MVILLIDGLGFNQFQEAKHSELTPNLAKMKLQKITTVAPSTTATALTSLTTGKPLVSMESLVIRLMSVINCSILFVGPQEEE